MTRPADPRGASRRGATDAGDLGYTAASDAPGPHRQQFSHTPHRPAPLDLGCHGYEVRGTMYTRCPAHRPPGSIDTGPACGACVACSV